MRIDAIISLVRKALYQSFTELDAWFDREVTLRQYRPISGGWTIDEILEHVGLTNHYLLILIRKGARKALQQAQQQDLAPVLAKYKFHEKQLAEVGQHRSFAWLRPEHMEPTGTKPLAAVRAQLQEQLQESLQHLGNLSQGEGILYRTTMSVNDLGKIDVYEYLYFLAQHGQRHLQQLANNEAEFVAQHPANKRN